MAKVSEITAPPSVDETNENGLLVSEIPDLLLGEIGSFDETNENGLKASEIPDSPLVGEKGSFDETNENGLKEDAEETVTNNWLRRLLLAGGWSQWFGRYGFLPRSEMWGKTVGGIYDFVKGENVIRFDRPHGNLPSHMNIACPPGVKDPHLPLPSIVVESVPAISKTVRVAGNIVLVAAIVVDGVKLGKDISEDVRNGKASVRTAKTAASIAGGWTGGVLGGMGGTNIGSMIGGSIGFLLGGVGAIPCAAVGGMIGGIAGAIGGSMTGNALASKTVEHVAGSRSSSERKLPKGDLN